ncbi:MAG TPA: 16S rRNA (cytosine(1402)-N(4))-methyltransferase RsmH [Stellaceae bacterium]|nr:16S rRNA (cytosine(1402)-N(4))-methyltransferase RsmH [Stellaceae bacterium]
MNAEIPEDRFAHVPVLLDEIVQALRPMDGGIIVDGTFGLGGYTSALLAAAPCTVWGIDRDPSAIARGDALVTSANGRLNLLQARFGDMEQRLAEGGVTAVDGVVLDLGVSSPQIDDARRGFSFRFDGPLDMRMGEDGPDAASVVNGMAEDDLADVLYQYGEERLSRRIARAIVAARREAAIERTSALAAIVRKVVPAGRDGIDPATRTFQALRIYVNDELGELDRGLVAAEHLLREGGRLAVVSFHSLEDRAIKGFLKARSGGTPAQSRHLPVGPDDRRAPSFTLISKKPITASPAELRRNPRARSAKLRVAERTGAPSWPVSTTTSFAPISFTPTSFTPTSFTKDTAYRAGELPA